jgi:hypothetical protein
MKRALNKNKEKKNKSIKKINPKFKWNFLIKMNGKASDKSILISLLFFQWQ